MNPMFEPADVTRGQQCGEALKRMHLLKLNEKAISIFKESRKVYCSENTYLRAANEKELKMIEQYEEKFGALVYHIIHSDGILGFGETYEMLNVSPYREDWSYERATIKNGTPICRSENITMPDYSESGRIGLHTLANGVLYRYA